jgi:hypothetical protein
MSKTMLLLAGLAILLTGASSLWAQGGDVAFQFSMGIQGSLSFFEAGVVFPSLGDSVFVGLKARIMSSLTWATFIHQNGESVSFHPVVAGGVISVGGASPMIQDVYRMYGGMDLLLGYTFTPYDSAIYKIGNLVGKNLTFALWGYYGLELFTADKIAYFVDSGGGYKSLFCDKDNMYAVASSWLGSGFGIKTGMRFYF